MSVLRLFSVCLFAAVLTGCASSAKVESMTVSESSASPQSFDPALQSNLQLDEVKGGSQTNPLWTSEIAGADFQVALRQSLDNAGLLSQANQAPLSLSANLLRVDQPMFGLDFTVTTVVEYVLVDKASGAVLLRETLTTPYTAGVGDAFVAVKRLRLANEGAAKENIAALLKRLGALKVDASQVSLKP